MVQPGDSLWAIARLHGTTVEALLKNNNLDPNVYLVVGQKLIVFPAQTPGTSGPTPGTPGPTPGGGSTVHTVVAGDTLWKIAQQHGTTVDALVKANTLEINGYLTIGQKLVIPSGTTTPAPQPVIHTVAAGDTLWKISQKYGTTVDALVRLNQMDPSQPIYVGQKIKISN